MASAIYSAEDGVAVISDASSTTSSRSSRSTRSSVVEQSHNNGSVIMRPSASFHDDPSIKVDAIPPDLDFGISVGEAAASSAPSNSTRPRLKLFVITLSVAIGVGLLLRLSSIRDLIGGGGSDGGGSYGNSNKNGNPYDPGYWGKAWPFVDPPYASGLEAEIASRGKMGNMYAVTFNQGHLHCKQKYDEVQPGRRQCTYSIPLGDTKFHESTEEEEEGMLVLYQKPTSYFAPKFVRTFLDDFPDDIVFLLGRDADDSQMYRLMLMSIKPDDEGDSGEVTPSHLSHLSKFGMSMTLTSDSGGTATFYSGVGGDPFELLRESVTMAVHEVVLGHFLLGASEDITLVYNSLILGGVSTYKYGTLQPLSSSTKDLPIYETARLHAMVLSISGGHPYFGGEAGTENATIRREAVCTDGTMLICSRTGLPTESALLRDPRAFGPLLVQNTNGARDVQITSGVLGVFNIAAARKPYVPMSNPPASKMAVSLRPSDIHDFGPFPRRTPYLAFSHETRQATVILSAEESFDMSLPLDRVWTDIVTIVPIAKLAQVYGSLAHYQVAPLGILGKFNAAGAILKREQNDKTAAARTRLLVRGCGQLSVLVRKMTSQGIFQKLPDAVQTVQVEEEIVPHKELSLVDLDDDTAPILGVGGKGFNLVQFNITCEGRDQWVTIDLVV
mmetsp:Transcript_34417/g.75338  ORF Transcript_34417/g.75338 Transcript_34417/m.75338 type:complete len:671 (-) Transcript_34417:127-2139(-)|eukprot:CAMPEP_0178560834 /NCGR_PEP_ID=MMETSP0697-20121206/11696_1 /TAXON_ID=265572 /ORGANISM="Extubocellulus spinifer, Strain CCMP396" /LENGTH=670 /DNA_ID=CAMNT_0020194113 /DNA_START=4 /DNA_END=2016 /DNA_ORIENTATION=+